MFYGKRYSGTCLTRRAICPPECSGSDKSCPEFIPDFVKIAEAYGAKGIRVTEASQVKSALKEAIETKGPVIIEFIVDQEENVYPMVPAGASLNEMIRGMA